MATYKEIHKVTLQKNLLFSERPFQFWVVFIHIICFVLKYWPNWNYIDKFTLKNKNNNRKSDQTFVQFFWRTRFVTASLVCSGLDFTFLIKEDLLYSLIFCQSYVYLNFHGFWFWSFKFFWTKLVIRKCQRNGNYLTKGWKQKK